MTGMLLRMLLQGTLQEATKQMIDIHFSARISCALILKRPLFLSIAIVSSMFINILNKIVRKKTI